MILITCFATTASQAQGRDTFAIPGMIVHSFEFAIWTRSAKRLVRSEMRRGYRVSITRSAQ